MQRATRSCMANRRPHPSLEAVLRDDESGSDESGSESSDSDFELELSTGLKDDEDDDSCEEIDHVDDDPTRSYSETIENVIRTVLQEPVEEVDPLLDKSSKAGIVWMRLADSQQTKIRNRVVFEGISGPTAFAMRRLNEKAYSAFKLMICESIIKNIVRCTNLEAIRQISEQRKKNPEKDYEDYEVEADGILAFIGVLLCRGVFAQKVSRRELWSAKYGLPIILKLTYNHTYTYLHILPYLNSMVKK